jgi:phenylalanyl-tRNA synthetase beta chain
MKIVHSWLKDYLGDALPSAENVAELLTFHSFEIDGVEEVSGETVIEVDVLPNRSSDCLCHRGVARELASLLDVPLVHDPLTQAIDLPATDTITIDIKNPESCPRFSAALITGIEVTASPAWLQTRLQALGVRSINNIVDATNYVMYAIGEPTHAYDADLFTQTNGQWNFVIRDARAGERVSLLAEGGKTEDRVVELNGTELLIVDGATDTPIGLAGVKGGRFAGVHAGTKNIIIEAAHFNPVTTRKTARRLGIVIDASKRFENEPARELVPFAQVEVIRLIKEIAGGTLVGWVDSLHENKPNPEVFVPYAQVNALLGLGLTTSEMKNIVLRIGAAIVSETEVGFTTVGPFERTDLQIPEDFIEEIGRIHGLHKIVSIAPEKVTSTLVNAKQFYTEALRQELINNGFSEIITSSFADKAIIQLQNSLAADKSFVRSTLQSNLTKALDQNFAYTDLLGIQAVRVFEIGTVFDKTDTSVTEHTVIAIGVRIKGNGYSVKDDGLVKIACETVEQVLNTKLSWDVGNGVAETNLSTVLDSLAVPADYGEYISKDPATFSPVSVYPAMSRDIALWVQEGELVYDVEAAIAQAAGDLVVRLSLFDTFTKDGRTSYAFRLVFQSFDRTLTDAEVGTHMDTVYEVVKEKGWEVR